MEQAKKFSLHRIVSVLLCLSMLLSPVAALADSAQTIAGEDLILIQDGGMKTVYKLVENYTLSDLVNGNKTFMIVSTDVPGANAAALGASETQNHGYMETKTGLTVFEIPTNTDELEAGTYTTNPFTKVESTTKEIYGEWKFEAKDSRYVLYTPAFIQDKDKNGNVVFTGHVGYLSTHKNGSVFGGYHSGHMMLISGKGKDESWGRLCKFTMASDNIDLAGLNTVYSAGTEEKPSGVTAGSNGYLSYGEYDGYYNGENKGKFTDFNIVGTPSAETRVQFYEKIGEKDTPRIEGCVYTKNGIVAAGTGKFAPTGAYIHLYVDGKLVQVPVTTDMLSDASGAALDLSQAKTYTNVKVSYNGVKLTDDFTLEVKAAQSLVKNNYINFIDNSSVFVLADPDDTDSFVDGGYIHISESAEAGYTRLLTYASSNLGTLSAQAYEIYVDGKKQLVINNANATSIWKTEISGHTGASGKFWKLNDFNNRVVLGYDSSKDTSNNGKDYALGVFDNTKDNGWKVLWHQRSEKTGLATYDGSGNTDTNWRTMYYNYNINGFSMRVEYANKNAEGYAATTNPYTGDTITSDLKDSQPYDRVYYYTRTSAYEDVTVYLTKNDGTVAYGAVGSESPAGVYIVMTVNDAYGVSHVTSIPVTLDMLVYNDENVKTMTATDGDVTYNNVKVMYQGEVVSNSFTLTVTQKLPENNYPKYPDPGSVEMTKGLVEEYEFLETGLTEVKLTLTGVPDASGSDVVLVLDNSGSMANRISDGTTADRNSEYNRRWQTVAAIKEMLKKFSESIDGYKSDISVSIVTFDGYTLIDGNLVMKATDGSTIHSQATTFDQPDTTHFLTSSSALASKTSASMPDINDRFINASELDEDTINKIAYSYGAAYAGSGTNYDRGLQIAYETVEGKQKLNAQAGTKRNSFVIFMSDGCSWQYNYVGGGSGGDNNVYANWDQYLSGKGVPYGYTSNEDLYEVFANTDGEHWMAEAIKGYPDKQYKIINPSANPADNYVQKVNGLGAELYVIGYGISADHSIQFDTANGVLKRISSDNTDKDGVDPDWLAQRTDKKYYYNVQNNENIWEKALSDITMKIRAASGAVLEDKLGEAFDLQMAHTVEGPRGPIELNPEPSIEVCEFITYRADQVGTIVDNTLVTTDMIGKVRPGCEDGNIIEQVTFSPDGTKAYSSMKGAGVNILGDDGIINAATFKYNTNKDKPVKIDSDSDGVADYDLLPETFAWLVGDIPQSRYELHYDVYLEGSMQGQASAGANLNTNEYAILKYKNYIGNICKIDAPKPNLPWEEAQTTYNYYLVNGKGQPIDANGNVTTFEKAVKIDALGTVTKNFNLNAVITVDGDGEGQIPDKYELYEANAACDILSMSASAQAGEWRITGETTYVESGSYTGADATNSDLIDNKNANYRETNVWFALVPKVCVDDTVVIDYGIPVDVDVLKNDDFKGDVENATITGYAPKVDAPSYFDLTSETPDGFVASNNVLNGVFGEFSCVDNKIRYQLDEMQMTDVDSVTYGAQYSGSEMPNGKYYGNLTVIPATLIYFEDDFVSFTVNNYSEEGEIIANSWTTVGTEKDDVQRDDRVGETIANVYGNDGAYVDSSKYSFGSAQKVTVERIDKYDENGRIASSTGKYATATFTFVGKGFDVISYTTNKTGTIAVQVFPYASLDATAPEENAVKSTVVDTYYGYKYAKVPVLDRFGNQIIEDGKPLYTEKWVPAESDTEDGLYQVPVIKWNTDTYGKYKVVITASYNWIFDHGQYGGSRLPNNKANATRVGKYDFYLDAIRIYDPANGGANSEDIKNAYIADGEYMPTFKELRNILIKDVKGFAADGSNVNGAVYIDNTSDSIKNTYTLNEYKDFGPNNEVYLANGNAVAFTVDTNGYASVQLAAKLAKGTGKLQITNVTNGLNKTLNITTATDLYYALDDILADNKANTVVLQNVDGNGIISVTNLKFTKDATASAQVQTVNAVYMNAKTAQAAVDYLNATQAAPEIYSIKSMKPSVKAGQKFTLTVTTNSEAEYVVVNGQTFTKYTENKANGQRIWKVTLALEGKGMTQISANAYGANDVESRTVSTTVRVTKAPAFSFGGIFDGFFGGLLGK